jgi:hypothetical protein
VWEVIARLNKVFGLRWNCYQIDQQIYGTPPAYIEIRVRIEVPDPENHGQTWFKEGWAGHEFNGKSIDTVIKTAYSRAVKKAASFLGVALYLYGVDIISDQASVQSPQQVTVVNPGYHNQPVQGAQTTQTQVGPPQLNNPAVPPQPMVGGVVQQQPQPNSPYPDMTNQGDPQQFIDDSQSVGMSGGLPPNSAPPPVQAQLGIQSAGQTGAGQTSAGAVAEFQLNAIKGLAAAQEIKDVLQVVHTALGDEAQNITGLEQLTSLQAIKVMEFLRSQAASGAK